MRNWWKRSDDDESGFGNGIAIGSENDVDDDGDSMPNRKMDIHWIVPFIACHMANKLPNFCPPPANSSLLCHPLSTSVAKKKNSATFTLLVARIVNGLPTPFPLCTLYLKSSQFLWKYLCHLGVRNKHVLNNWNSKRYDIFIDLIIVIDWLFWFGI